MASGYTVNAMVRSVPDLAEYLGRTRGMDSRIAPNGHEQHLTPQPAIGREIPRLSVAQPGFACPAAQRLTKVKP